MKKYIFGRRFKYADYPQILKCENESERLTNLIYEAEDEYENGGSKDKWSKALDRAEQFDREIFAKVTFNEFCNKNLVLMDRTTKKKRSFEELFGTKFEELSISQKEDLLSIVHNIWGWKLPAEYYDKHDNIEKY